MSTLPIYIGGLFRCCMLSIADYNGPEDVGTTIPCRYHKDQEPVAKIILDSNGEKVWAWIGGDDGAYL